MKKTIFFVLTLTLIAIFCFPGQLKGTNKKRFLIEKHQPGAVQTITPEKARTLPLDKETKARMGFPMPGDITGAIHRFSPCAGYQYPISGRFRLFAARR